MGPPVLTAEGPAEERLGVDQGWGRSGGGVPAGGGGTVRGVVEPAAVWVQGGRRSSRRGGGSGATAGPVGGWLQWGRRSSRRSGQEVRLGRLLSKVASMGPPFITAEWN